LIFSPERNNDASCPFLLIIFGKELLNNNMSFPTEIKTSTIDGRGLFALKIIPGRRKLGEMTGDLVSTRKARQMMKDKKRMYIVEFDEKYALVGTDDENHMRYINHSCKPNTYIRLIYHRVEFYSLRPIKKGEELTADYGETHHDGKLKCKCGAPGCKGFL